MLLLNRSIARSAFLLLLLPLRTSAQDITFTKPVLRLGSADGDSSQILFGASSAARRSNGDLVISNTGTNQIRVYSASGKLRQTLGRKGGGPGEFQFLQRVDVIRGDTIVAYDIGNGRITWFDPSGKVARSASVQPLGNGVLPRAAGFTDNGRMLAHSDFGRVFTAGEHRDTLTFVLYDVRGTPVDTLGRYPGPEEFHLVGGEFAVRRSIPFGRDAYASAHGGRIAIGSNDAYTFDVFNSSAKRVVTHREARPAVKTSKAHLAILDRKYLEGMPAQMRTATAARMKEFPVRETYPYYEGLLASDDGSVWTAEVLRPDDRTRVWVVRTPDGARPRQIRVPAGVDLVSVGNGYAIGHERDAVGVESIVVYSMPITTR
jgi:hypothetical protein